MSQLYPKLPSQPDMQQTIGVQPVFNQINAPFQPVIREWTTSLCGCFEDLGECCCAYFCTTCYMITLFDRADEKCLGCLFGGLLPLRTKIRIQRNIEGSICGDFCALYWCGFCAMVQMGIELKTSHQ